MTEKSFFPGVIKWYDDPLSYGSVIVEDWLTKAPPSKEARESISFDSLMNFISIPLDIFCDNLDKAPNPKNPSVIAKKIVYLRPVMQYFLDIRSIGLGDLEFREMIIPVNAGNVSFPLVIVIKESARHDVYYHQFYRILDAIDEFKQKFPADLSFMHDAGYRVAFFEEREPINDVRAVLSSRGDEWLKMFGENVLDEKIEEKFKKHITRLNKFRPKGTYFTNLYTLNMREYPICWNDDRLGNRDYKLLNKSFTLYGSLTEEFKNYLAYVRHEVEAMDFKFSDDEALKQMKMNKLDRWERVINIYNENLKQGTPQDIIANREGISQMTVSRWISSVKGEIARLRGDAYEIHLDNVWKASGKWKNVVHIGGEGKPDFLRFNFDDSIDIVSVKCFNAVRPETSLITDEMNAKCEIKPEIARVKELLALGEHPRLIVHFFNYNSKFLEERVIDSSNLPSNLTFLSSRK